MSRTNEGAAWTILGYLLSGPLFWGGVGYGLDAWLGTGYFLASGLLLGMGAALYLVWLRFGRYKSPNPQNFDFAQRLIYA